jgi:hypothetical protein
MKRGKARAPVFFFFFAFFLLSLSVNSAGAADRWYISNAAGMALEPAFSRLALRGKYALEVTEILPGDLPANLREFYDRIYREARIKAEAETGENKAAEIPFSLRLEKRILYENRKASRRQWLFLDGESQIRLAAAFALDPADYPPPPEPGDAADAGESGDSPAGKEGEEVEESGGEESEEEGRIYRIG